MSNDIYGGLSNITTDSYQIELQPTDGSNIGSLAFTATHIANGTYSASYIPKKSGNFSLSINLKGIHVLGSPFNVIVYPGHIDHTFSEVIAGLGSTDPEITVAGETLILTIQAKDLYGNLMSNSNDQDALTVSAVYVNHSSYPSPIGVSDLDNWEEIWGKNITGEVVENSDSPGQYMAYISIFRAGMYGLQLSVFGENIAGFPKNLDV